MKNDKLTPTGGSCAMPMTVTPTQHEKNEWSRLAQAAYRSQVNEIGHTYSVAASLPHDGELTVERFDQLQANYRQWLIDGTVTLADGATVRLRPQRLILKRVQKL
jgi:hypothetical protein